MEPSTVIQRLGGTVKTALICDVSPSAVTQWKTNGIPKAQEKYLRLLRPDVFEDCPCLETTGSRFAS